MSVGVLLGALGALFVWKRAYSQARESTFSQERGLGSLDEAPLELGQNETLYGQWGSSITADGRGGLREESELTRVLKITNPDRQSRLSVFS